MNKQNIAIINNMRLQGKTASDIALTLQISVNTVRSYIRRHPELQDHKTCRNCGKAIIQPEGRKQKLFCSDKCRMQWWNNHRKAVHKKAFYYLICNYCEKEFKSYGNQNRKYCCRECYLKSRKAYTLPNSNSHHEQLTSQG